ncbi:uncharacterized protein PAC_11008 [Phialocephala subalpina]|uniref:DUF7905 domain-containing protein n=1 Tax=Phialocephala subalpina TaxID=576137 RepID=A0A1L7X7W6_9HELO|nr:uncharacterized protein PAC_11008 [Phialocephala subalpina]
MDPLKNMEKENAREWDEVSNASSLPPPRNPAVPSAAYGNLNNYSPGSKPYSNQAPRVTPAVPTSGPTPPVATYGRTPSLPTNGPTPSRPTPARTPAPKVPANRSPQKPTREHEGSNSGASSGSSVKISVGRPQPPQGSQRPSYGSQQYQQYQRTPNQARPQLTPARAKWAKAPGLVTNRRADNIEEQAIKKELAVQYLKRPDRDEEFPAIGFYLWPSNDEGERPSGILGANLEELNAVRVDSQVFVEMNETDTCIKICCRATEDSDDRIQSAIKAIRDVICHSRALRFAALPTHIAIPPTASAMMTIVKPAIVIGEKKQYEVTDLLLAGEKLSEKDKLVWKNERPECVLACRKKFEEALVEGLRALAPYRGWMQMRLRFGHAVLYNPKNKFRKGNSDWKDFFNMVNSKQMRSRFVPNFSDANVIRPLIHKILDWPERYKPADGKLRSLQEVGFKDTEIVFFETSDGPFRIEAEIDRLDETKEGEYQAGATRLFKDHNRNKRIRVTTVDVEKEIDWDLEVISDNEVPAQEVPQQLDLMIKKSVNTRTAIRYDSLDLPYPDVKPVPGSGMKITAVVIKSVIQYAVIENDYVVEIAVYRRFLGPEMEPEMSVGVSMYQKLWDSDEMRSLHGPNETRSWEDPLKAFFGHGFAKGEVIDGSKGVEKFLTEVETIQGFLVDAVKIAGNASNQNQDTWGAEAGAA